MFKWVKQPLKNKIVYIHSIWDPATCQVHRKQFNSENKSAKYILLFLFYNGNWGWCKLNMIFKNIELASNAVLFGFNVY